MHYLTKVVFSFFLLLTSLAYAGASHNHGHGHGHAPVSKAVAEEVAINSVNKLVERESIEKSWTSVPVSSAEQKEFEGRKEWVIVFKNEKVSDPKEQTLYVFLTLDGQYIAANYTGD